MRRTLFFLCVIVGVGGCRSNDAPTPPTPAPEPSLPPVEWSADLQPIVEANNQFALDLYAKLSAAEKGNLFFSPFSVQTALGMTATGARGPTRDQMVNVLHLPKDEQKALAAGDLGRFYTQPHKEYQLSVANALWGQTKYPWRPEFLTLQKERFGAGFLEADFKENPDTERVRINKWVETQTHEKIKDLLREEHITTLTRMVLTNAIYFKGTWRTQFPPKKTRDTLFHLADGGRITVPTMYEDVTCRWRYLPDAGAKMLELPYEGGDLTMVIILPKLPDGLPALEKQLTPATLDKWIAEMRVSSKPVGVSLPKFRFERAYDLPESLKSLGMVDAFIPGKADFTGMASGADLYISAVAHKAFVDVNEEGTEAAAATAVVVSEAFGEPPAFTAEHPFLFLIRDVKHGTILFMGRVMNPKG